MLKTILYEEKDGERIIVGFDQLLIDAASTANRAKELMESDPIYEELKEAHKESEKLGSDASTPMGVYKASLKRLYEIHHKYNNKFRNIQRTEPLHFEPRANEMLADPDKYDQLVELFTNRKEGQLVTVEGKVIHGQEEE